MIWFCPFSGLKGKTWLIEAVVFFTVTIVVAESQGDPFETEFRQLYSSTEEKDALESIRALHQQVLLWLFKDQKYHSLKWIAFFPNFISSMMTTMGRSSRLRRWIS